MGNIEKQIDIFMQGEMPQIKMHGGDWRVVDFDNGTVEILLEDACSGCGISPMTIQALKNRMPKQIDAVTDVIAQTEEVEEDITSGPF